MARGRQILQLNGIGMIHLSLIVSMAIVFICLSDFDLAIFLLCLLFFYAVADIRCIILCICSLG